MKKCTRCGERKKQSGFANNRCQPDGLQVWCRPCSNAARLESRYGLTADEVADLLKVSACMACGATETKGCKSALHIDHDHATGHVRGVLCGSCNRALGDVDDNVERLVQLISYLDRVRVTRA